MKIHHPLVHALDAGALALVAAAQTGCDANDLTPAGWLSGNGLDCETSGAPYCRRTWVLT
jgi:hypothetical protein